MASCAPKREPSPRSLFPGAIQTTPFSINPAGAITGDYLDANYYGHGFLRARDGTLTTFDDPGGNDTTAVGINPAGTIAGVFHNYDVNFVGHGFLRTHDGTFTNFDVPGNLTPSQHLYQPGRGNHGKL